MTVVVPVRAGSNRIKGKNLKVFKEVGADGSGSLLSWKLNQLLEVFAPENVLLSTDWDRAMDVGLQFGIQVVEREARLCAENAPFDEVILDAAQKIKTEHMAWAPVTSPFFGPLAMRKFLSNYFSGATNAQENGYLSVGNINSYFFLGGSPVNFPIGRGHIQTQDISSLLEWDWAFSARKVENVKSNSYMFSSAPEFFEISRFENLDINDEIDFQMAEYLIPLYKSMNGGIR
jgi:N-acylneuraminate cytidylyltransferase